MNRFSLGRIVLVVLLLMVASLSGLAAETNGLMAVDLRKAFAKPENADWTDPKHSFAAVPKGETNLSGIPFRCDGVIQLSSARFSQENKNFRQRVPIPLPTNQFAALHILGGLSSVENSGIVVAEIIFTYTNGTTARLPIKSNVHMKDWWRMGHEEPPLVSDPAGRVVWRGVHAQSQSQNKTLRLYCVTLENPKPAEKISKLEIVSGMKQPGLFVTGVTLDLRPADKRSPLEPDLDLDESPLSKKLSIKVVNAVTSEPIPNAVLASKGIELIKTPTNSYRSAYEKNVSTDEKGEVVLPYSEWPLEKLTINATAPNYAPWLIGWELAKNERIPAQTTLRLQPGLAIGGKVVDENGVAISGAAIRVSRIYRGGEPMDRGNNRLNFTTSTNLTDGLGQWSLSGVPESLLDSLSIRITHPDFSDSSETPNAAAVAKLRTQSHVTTLQRGFEITGYVTDANRVPIAGARVIYDRRFYATAREATTDAAGLYRITKARLPAPPPLSTEPTNEVMVTAFTDRHAPTMHKIKITEQLTRLDFVLTPGNIVRGRVIDPEGNGIADASVTRGTSSLQREDVAEWRGKTDSNGQFEWTGSPPTPQEFSFYARGFRSSEAVLQPGDTNHTITLKRESSILGRVVDAETQEPVTHFFAMSGQTTRYTANTYRLYGSSSDEKEFNDPAGAFEIPVRSDRANGVQVRAEGYLTAVKPASTNSEPLLFALQRTSNFQGRVVDPTGRPIPGIAIAGASTTPGSSVMIDRTGISRLTRVDRVTAEANGEFTFQPTTEIASLVAANSTHFGQVTAKEFQQTKTIIVQPHGRIEGNLRIGKNVGANRGLSLNPGRGVSSGISFQIPEFRLNTDGEGRFVFESVPAGQVSIMQTYPTGPSSWTSLRSTTVNVKPGQTTQITLGGDGATIRGQLHWPLGVEHTFTKVSQSCNLRDLDPATIGRDPRMNAIVPRFYSFRIGDNGVFEAPDIPPGNYELIIELREAPAGQLTPSPFMGKPVGTFQKQIQINGANDEIDLGDITLSDKPVVRARF